MVRLIVLLVAFLPSQNVAVLWHLLQLLMNIMARWERICFESITGSERCCGPKAAVSPASA
ncbi:hypothetical protein Scep_028898 [Stephania cephalantha]|uniref:Uncharacterized protein n=1 Tax=Stephania cephalantha TaxID=152367 RepID=A0AAP0EAS8_9MAGN